MPSLSWQVLHGHGAKNRTGADWEGLLPEGESGTIHPELRAEILKYGEMAQATYDGFYGDLKDPTNFGQNRFPPETLLENSLPKNSKARGYIVVKYLWATAGVFNISVDALLPSLKRLAQKHFQDQTIQPNLVGYIAHSPETEDGIDVVIAWRGTIVPDEWISNVLGSGMKDWEGPAYKTEGAKVHMGFLDVYTNSMLREQLPPKQDIHLALDRLLLKHKVRSITTTGHSLGGALAIISAAETAQFLAQRKATDSADKTRANETTGDLPPVCCFAFAPPQPGNSKFLDLLREMKVPALRMTNERGGDIVPKVPNVFWTAPVKATVASGKPLTAAATAVTSFPDVLGNAFNFLREHRWGYEPVEVALYLDSRLSNILRPPPSDWREYLGMNHNLELYLWLVATQYGGQEEPTGPDSTLSAPDRDWALLNKGDDELKENFHFPKSWWVPPDFKGLVQTGKEGRWRRPIA